MATAVALGALLGTGWGAIALGVFAAMRAHALPVPAEVAVPVAVALVVGYLPVVAALGVEALLGRSSPSFAELVGASLACGRALGILLTLIMSARRDHRRLRRRV